MTGVIALYDQAVAAGRIADDPAQRAVLPALDRALAAVGRTPPAAGEGWLGRLFGGGNAREGQAAVPGSGGLYLWGGVGRGKSMLMDLAMAAATTTARRRVHFHAFMQEVQAGLNEARRAGAQDAVRPVAEHIAAEVRLLCFDEMQITDIADAMIVGRLFQILFDHGVVLITTSNRAPDELYKNGLNRDLFLPFIDLIKTRMEIAELASPRDHRQDRQAGSQVWFTPADAAARAAMDAIWARLTHGAPPRPKTLSVQGRDLVLPAFHEGVARASFWDLCGQPRGPADYLAIAAAVRVLMIDSIPRLSAANFNEARRFVTLGDALYEARVRLIASAADLPDRLYLEGEGAFEFERTASRLAEMQAADWGS
ncbi:AFG1 family ATPase [Paracoccus suum]|uniref:AFG1 family ATPase n=1 Tax=Paracoccus suum TaxID=2259340 RepID=A0A344PGL3_9RHOB|nr:cell division protein ZapE [Paracoccus suum]AXC48518.1 AFG1 family ATPase [Paracoccus suum]